jgi:hypothetical protein
LFWNQLFSTIANVKFTRLSLLSNFSAKCQWMTSMLCVKRFVYFSCFIIISPSNVKFYFHFIFQSTTEYLTFAAISKLIAAGTTYPYQVIRTRLQDQNHTYKGTWDCIKTTWRYERIHGFYKGIVPYLVHVTPNICLVMLIYEKFTH